MDSENIFGPTVVIMKEILQTEFAKVKDYGDN